MRVEGFRIVALMCTPEELRALADKMEKAVADASGNSLPYESLVDTWSGHGVSVEFRISEIWARWRCVKGFQKEACS